MQPLQLAFFKNKYKKMQRNILIMNIPHSEHPFTTDYFSRTDEMTVKILIPKLIYSGHFTADPSLQRPSILCPNLHYPL